MWELIELANHHPRVNILQPGPGVGGHCIAVDPWFIVSAAPDESKIIHEARRINDSKPSFVLNKTYETIEETTCANVAALGLSFKADIDDLRESPALDIVKVFAQEQPEITILAVEPNIQELPAELEQLSNVQLAELDTALEQSEVVLLLVDHEEFKNVRATELSGKKLIDTRGVWRDLT